MKTRILIIFLAALLGADSLRAQTLLIPMDEKQENHLKAYGLAYWALANGVTVDWLLNYRGGSFAIPYNKSFRDTALTRGVTHQLVSGGAYNNILAEVSSESSGMDAVKLEKPPKIAVYAPTSHQPWDDAVTLVLTYAEIPYDQIYDNEVLLDTLKRGRYDWLHLHHEDFTGQYGKFWASYHNTQWYKDQVRELEEMARANGFDKVSEMKLAVALKVREFASGGGFLFAMCSATDSYDIALAAAKTDICEHMYDGDGRDPRLPLEAGFLANAGVSKLPNRAKSAALRVLRHRRYAGAPHHQRPRLLQADEILGQVGPRPFHALPEP